ncbi:MAG: hypothetical protein Harvfovirus32_6 [Harvfovirus sp.]|uniref:Uncharacterized protein n=1 Tax=Harvfovirus sp. TaxID=2487768 RepID=A0A3G5A2P8_9VIRU|nr:MAG: hypothetical protein Harvfovirus32_6 [Harvfovirus sp.]
MSADWSEEKFVEVAERWKKWFFWDPVTEELVIKSAWHSRHDKIVSYFDPVTESIVHRLMMYPFAVDDPECVAYKQYLEQKMLILFEKRWNSFKLREEVRSEKDLVGSEATQLEEKWEQAHIVWYDGKSNAICDNPRRYQQHQRAHSLELTILRAILRTRVESIKSLHSTATLKLLEDLDSLQKKWASFLDSETPVPPIIQSLRDYRQHKTKD